MAMLENIKTVLGFTDKVNDNVINYYITSVSQRIKNYCNVAELPAGLEGTVEQVVIGIMQDDKNKVKSITRGDTKVEYNVETSDSVDILTNYYKQLRLFRVVRK